MADGWDWKGQDNWYIYWAPTEALLDGRRRRLSAVATTLDAAIASYNGFNMYGTGFKVLVEQQQPTMVSDITTIFVASGVWNGTYDEFLAASGVTS
ncbi:hypothetical protein [Pseudomonas sp. dw_358]|uniref:hypothetical protein n=1 Tax=Pseudomonas sp. dw_358 TaxID=2720083 RepID=UPI001BD37ECF|nr:hypothetical protein [Pseudomonas sp. dw_358]